MTGSVTEGSPEFVPEVERIAAFDNDGMLWVGLPWLIRSDKGIETLDHGLRRAASFVPGTRLVPWHAVRGPSASSRSH